MNNDGAGGLTRQLAAFLATLRYEDLPAAVVEAARRGVLDWLGCALSGSRHESVGGLVTLMREMGGREQAAVLGRDVRLGFLEAPLVNGQMAHLHDYDDTCQDVTVVHLSSPILPALFALTEYKAVTGEQFITAYAAAFEAGLRIGRACGAQESRGWHPTGTLGTLAAAAGAARLLELEPEAFEHALAYAATQSAGLLRNRGTLAKSFHAGRAASSGLLAAFMASRGFDASLDSLAAEQGYCELHAAASVDREALVRDPGVDWALLRNGLKPYPCAIGLHALIDGVIALRARVPDGCRLERIELSLSPYTRRYRLHDAPEDALSARFSIHHSAAVAWLDGAASLAQYAHERVAAADVRDLRSRVTVAYDDALQTDQARVTVVTDRGREDYHVAHASGTAAAPTTREAIEEKFKAQAAPVIGNSRASLVARLIARLETAQDVRTIVTLCAGSRRT